MPNQHPPVKSRPLPYRASSRDSRFSYCLYLPERAGNGDESTPLLVLIHDEDRDAAAWLRRFVDFADSQGVALLAPLFPAGLPDARDWENFSELQKGSVHFDQALLAMVDEVAGEYGVEERFKLFGFAAGASFCQRFALCHPDRLRAVSVAAPDRITLPDSEKDWPMGLRGVGERLGVELRWGAMAAVATHLVVGSEPGNDPDSTGETVAGIQQLSQACWRRGMAVRLDIIPGVHRQVEALIPASQAFFRQVLGAGDPEVTS